MWCDRVFMLARRMGAILYAAMGADGALFIVKEFDIFVYFHPIAAGPAAGQAKCALYVLGWVVILEPAGFVSEISYALVFGLATIVRLRASERSIGEKRGIRFRFDLFFFFPIFVIFYNFR